VERPPAIPWADNGADSHQQIQHPPSRLRPHTLGIRELLPEQLFKVRSRESLNEEDPHASTIPLEANHHPSSN